MVIPQKMSVATLGAPGTFAHQATVCLQEIYPELAELRYYPSMDDVYAGLAAGEVDAIVLSEQTSLRGWDDVNERIATPGSSIFVYGAAIIPYHCHLLVREGTRLSDITHVYGHGSIRQCRPWLDAHLPGVPATVHEKNSVVAASEVAAGDGHGAVVGTFTTAELTGLVPLATDIDNGATAVWWVMTRSPILHDEPDEVIVTTRLPGDGSLGRLIALMHATGFDASTVYNRPTGEELFAYDYMIGARRRTDATAGALEQLSGALAELTPPARLIGAYHLHHRP